MELLETASEKSVWRGLDYYERKQVISWKKSSGTTYEGKVKGSNGEVYDVHVDTSHPKRSTCTCPFAQGRYVVCKHAVAVYFTANPQEAEKFLKQVEEWEQEEEEMACDREREIREYVDSLSPYELREELYNILLMMEDDSD